MGTTAAVATFVTSTAFSRRCRVVNSDFCADFYGPRCRNGHGCAGQNGDPVHAAKEITSRIGADFDMIEIAHSKPN